MRYLDAEYIRSAHEETERMCPPSNFDCGGTWGFGGPPCGGCNDCAHAMTAHWLQKEIDRMRMFHRAGFDYADPSLIKLEPYEYAPYHGEGGYHCWTSKEIDAPIYPWNRKHRDMEEQ